jgi:hypothetical protein
MALTEEEKQRARVLCELRRPIFKLEFAKGDSKEEGSKPKTQNQASSNDNSAQRNEQQ